MKHGDKAQTRVELRRKATPNKSGFKVPGSMKKPWPLTTDQYKHGSERNYEKRVTAERVPSGREP